MKTIGTSIIILISLLSQAQVDTIKYRFHTLEKTETKAKRKKIANYLYLVDSKKVSEQEFDSLKKESNAVIAKCKPCWLRSYDTNGKLMNEGLAYTDCYVGAYIKYYESGHVEMTAFYKTNDTGDWDNFLGRGFCSVKEGTWLYYKEEGTIEKVEGFENGKLIK